jgi:hypothetical protein
LCLMIDLHNTDEIFKIVFKLVWVHNIYADKN